MCINKFDCCVCVFYVAGPQELVSPCLAPDYSGQWEHADVLYTVKGQKAGMRNTLCMGFCIFNSIYIQFYSPQLFHYNIIFDFIFTCVCSLIGEPIYETCLTKVEKMIYKRVRKIEGVKDMDFYAFSYYYDRAVDLSLIGMRLA